jgi:hypothetical protein
LEADRFRAAHRLVSFWRIAFSDNRIALVRAMREPPPPGAPFRSPTLARLRGMDDGGGATIPHAVMPAPGAGIHAFG